MSGAILILPVIYHFAVNRSLYSFLQYLKSICQFSLVISHIDTMRDFTDQLLEIESDNGFSRINF